MTLPIHISSIQNEGICTFCNLSILGLGIFAHFAPPPGYFGLEGISIFFPVGILGLRLLSHFALYQAYVR